MVRNDSVRCREPTFIRGAFDGRGLGLNEALGMENDDVRLRGPAICRDEELAKVDSRRDISRIKMERQ